MNEQQLAAVKRALEKIANVNAMDYEYQAWAREALAEQPAQQEPVGMVKDLFTQAAWEKLDVRGSTKVYLCTPPAAPVQEPIGYFTVNDYDMWEQIDGTSGKPLYERPAAQPVPVKTYHDGKPWPVAPVPHECQTEAEKTAYAFGWWKAMEYVREHGVIK
jgi:hypothetical protein